MPKEGRILLGKNPRTGLNVYRYPVKAVKPLSSKPRTKISRVSKKRAKEEREYSSVRAEYLLEHPECEIKVDGCTYEATDIHHKKGRVGKLLTDKRYFISGCRNCHHWAEINPVEAKKKGVSLSRLSKE